MHCIISSPVLPLHGAWQEIVRSVLLSLHSLKGQWFLAHWIIWGYRPKDEA